MYSKNKWPRRWPGFYTQLKNVSEEKFTIFALHLYRHFGYPCTSIYYGVTEVGCLVYENKSRFLHSHDYINTCNDDLPLLGK